MKIGSFDTSSITAPLSRAVDKVEDKVSATVDQVEAKVDSTVTTVKQTVVQAEQKVETFAKSEYGQAKDYAKLTGKKLEQTFDSTVKAVKDAAPSFRIPQGVKDVSTKLFGSDAPAKGVEGGADLGRKNGGDPSEVVDLKDPAKFLSTYGQKDKDDDTVTDGSRCQSNTIIAGLLMKGGPDEVKAGLTKALDKAKAQLSVETDPGRKKALEGAVKNLQSAVDGLSAGKVTRGQLDHAADALFMVMTPAKDPNTNQAQFAADGTPAPGLKGVEKDQIREMEKQVGLTDGADATLVKEKWFAPFTDDNREVSDNVWDKIQPGKAAHVGVNLYGEDKAKGEDQWGNKLQYTSEGLPFYTERVPNPDYKPGKPETIDVRHYVDQEAQHAVLFGKNADGTRYIYNPMGDPPYMTEKPGDKASSEALDTMSASLMGVKKGKTASSNDWTAEVTPY
jgi:putative sterol carrier protein